VKICFFYAVSRCPGKANWPRSFCAKRFKIMDLKAEDVRIVFFGVDAIHGAARPPSLSEPYEVAVSGSSIAALKRAEGVKSRHAKSTEWAVSRKLPQLPKGSRFSGTCPRGNCVWSTLVDKKTVTSEPLFLGGQNAGSIWRQLAAFKVWR